MPYTIPEDYDLLSISEVDGWLVRTRTDRRTPGATSGMVRPPMTDETAAAFHLPADHEARTKYMATITTGSENVIRYTDTFEDAAAFIIENA